MCALVNPDTFKSDRLAHISSWWRLLKVVALCLQLKSKLKNRKVERTRECKVCYTVAKGVSYAYRKEVLKII